MISRFNIIVACDNNDGIAKRGTIPWKNSSDMRFFREKTMGAGKNVVIMGRKTYETLDGPLEGRLNIVISRSWIQGEHPEVKHFTSIIDALKFVGTYGSSYEDVYIMGGEQIYRECIKNLLYLCDEIIVTRLKTNYECDQFFPWDDVKKMKLVRDAITTRDWQRHYFDPNVEHTEMNYLRAIKRILDDGEDRSDRTGIGTKSLFGEISMVFDISERCPILTTRKLVAHNSVLELLWMLKGKTDSKLLEEKGNMFWKRNTTRFELDKRGLRYEEGDAGPIYGWQWRHWGAKYVGCHEDYSGQGTDQLAKLITGLREDPFSRRHVLSAWNVEDIDKGILPPCHTLVQFYVSSNRKNLSCQVYMRSADMCLGVPYNISFYGILTHLLARICDMTPKKLTIVAGDAHIYQNHILGARKLISRSPMPWCKLHILGLDSLPPTVEAIDALTTDNFRFEDYVSHEHIGFDFAV